MNGYLGLDPKAVPGLCDDKATNFVPDTVANKSAPVSQPESAPKDRYKAAFTEIARVHAADGQVIVCVSHSDGIDAFRKAFGCTKALPKPPCLCAAVAVELAFDKEDKVVLASDNHSII